jgi:hypothetical protein
VSLFLQALLEEVRHTPLIFDNQNLHLLYLC